MISANLLPQNPTSTPRYGNTIIAVILGVCGALLCLQCLKSHVQYRALATKRAEYKRLADARTQQAARYAAKTQTQQHYAAQLHTLIALTNAITSPIQLQSLNWEHQQITLKGLSKNPQAIVRLAHTLKTQAFTKKVALNALSSSDKSHQTQFTLTVTPRV